MPPLRLLVALPLAACAGCVGLRSPDGIVTQPFRGITLISRTESSPRPVRMHVVLVDLATPGLSFKLSPPAGARDAVRQTTLAFLRQEKAQLAVNAHFFVPFPSPDTDVDLVGLAVSAGRIVSPFEPQPVSAGFPDQSYAILAHAPALNLDPGNRAALVRRDPAYPDGRHTLPRVTLWNAVSGSAQIVTDGAPTIPTYTGAPGGLRPANNYSDARSWYALPRARTAVGLTADGRRLVIFTADQAAGSAGLTVAEVARFLVRDYRVAQALNLDGGGSTTLAMQDPVTGEPRLVNTPSDPPPGRAVGSSLAIFAAPMPARGAAKP
ncbi:MAG: phosphodiester glycosidase family protein [Opitutaceae bacterium]|nr:phosphodiester glycosidase family protein [Opitutaceae bacterium]